MRTLEFTTAFGKMGNGRSSCSHCLDNLLMLINLFFLLHLRHGKGKWTNTNGDYYDGDFVNEKRHGYGVYTWPNGNEYRGDFVDDNRHGKVCSRELVGSNFVG